MSAPGEEADFSARVESEAVAPYRRRLERRRADLVLKRCFDIFAAVVCILLLIPLYLVTAAAIRLTSKGPVLFLQKRVGYRGRFFRIFKFRTMTAGTDVKGELTVGNDDPRITPLGRFLRVSRIDEFPQFVNVLRGDMSIIGVRPEVPHYAAYFTDEDFATLLLRPGMTSPASIRYRHENELLRRAADPEKEYLEKILPEKMAVNRAYVRDFSFREDLRILGRTFRCIFEKDPALEK